MSFCYVSQASIWKQVVAEPPALGNTEVGTETGQSFQSFHLQSYTAQKKQQQH